MDEKISFSQSARRAAFVGDDGIAMGVDSFGESAPAPAVFKHFGLTVEGVMAAVQKVL